MSSTSEPALDAGDLIRDAAVRELRAAVTELDEVTARLAATQAELAVAEDELDRLRGRRSVRAADALARLARGGRRR